MSLLSLPVKIFLPDVYAVTKAKRKAKKAKKIDKRSRRDLRDAVPSMSRTAAKVDLRVEEASALCRGEEVARLGKDERKRLVRLRSKEIDGDPNIVIPKLRTHGLPTSKHKAVAVWLTGDPYQAHIDAEYMLQEAKNRRRIRREVISTIDDSRKSLRRFHKGLKAAIDHARLTGETDLLRPWLES